MPYTRCPLCGEIYHVNVTNPSAWYEEHYPGVPKGELVPAKCLFCWQELARGDCVEVRKPLGSHPQAEAGQRGVVKDVYASKDGDMLFLVELSTGETRFLLRGELRKTECNSNSSNRSPRTLEHPEETADTVDRTSERSPEHDNPPGGHPAL